MTSATAETAFVVALAIEGDDALPVIQDRIRVFAGPLGYDRFVLFSFAALPEEAVETIYWVEGDWFGAGEAVDAATYVRRCPMTRHMFGERQPFFWSKRDDGKGELYRIVRAPRGSGVHGVQIPVFGPLGLEGAMSLGGERIDSSPATRMALSLVGAAAFFAVRRLLEASPENLPGTLSDREREILTWTAAGRRQADIAVTLGLSPRTVENHLRRIRRRLGVRTTAQAVRVAIRRGEIEN